MDNHATIKLAEYIIPLIGIPPYYTIEECGCCHNEYHFQELELNSAGNQFLCAKCKSMEVTEVGSSNSPENYGILK